LAIAAGGLAFRLPRLDKRPMHCDEANQATKAGLLLESGVYRYDPQEHHGPSLYWLTVPALGLSSARDFAHTSEPTYRLVPVIFGAGLVLLLLLLGDALGRPAAVVAAVLTAISPAMVFYSRYYIQETLLVFFTLAAIASGWRYIRSRSIGWAIAAGAFVGLMHATKETWVLSAAAAGGGLVLSIAWTRWRVGPVARPPSAGTASDTPEGGRATIIVPLLAAFATFLVVVVALYSSFGANWQGPLDSALAYGTYLRRGSEQGIHVHPWYYYLQVLFYNRPAKGFFWTEGLIAVLAVAGFVVAMMRPAQAGRQPGAPSPGPDPGFCRFLAFYTLLLAAFYAAVPYKTPWCALGFLDGMILLAGVGAWAMVRTVPTMPLKIVLVGVLVAGALHLGRQSYLLNFRFDADQRNPYVYAQTSTDLLNLAAQMERLAGVSPDGYDMVIHVVTPENYWPLPWYLRRFNPDHVGYWQDPSAWQADTSGGRGPLAGPGSQPSIVILTPDVQPLVDAHLEGAYNQQMMYGLRPGVLLNVYVREDLWDAFTRAAAQFTGG
jgi:uncharacterized protein (TIGR03663 family)